MFPQSVSDSPTSAVGLGLGVIGLIVLGKIPDRYKWFSSAIGPPSKRRIEVHGQRRSGGRPEPDAISVQKLSFMPMIRLWMCFDHAAHRAGFSSPVKVAKISGFRIEAIAALVCGWCIAICVMDGLLVSITKEVASI